MCAAEDAGRLRDALGVAVPVGLPAACTESVPTPVVDLVARYARTHGPFLAAARRRSLRHRRRAGACARSRRSERDGRVGARRVPARRGRARVVRRRRAAPAPAPLAGRAAQGGRAGRRRHPRPLPARAGTASVSPAAASTPSSTWSPSCRARRSSRRPSTATSSGSACPSTTRPTSTRSARPATWCGSAPAPSAPPTAASGWRSATRPGCCCPPAGGVRARSDLHTALLAAPRAARRLVLGRPHRAPPSRPASPSTIPTVLAALWDLVWAGLVTNDSLAPLRAFVGSRGPPLGGPRRVTGRRARSAATGPAGRARARRPAPAAGRSSRRCSSRRPRPPRPPTPGPSSCSSATACSPARRRWARGPRAGSPACTRCSRRSRSGARCAAGYFVAGLGAAQFAVAGAVDRLRRERDDDDDQPPIVLAATDPAQPFGAAIPWPETAGRPARGGGRVRGARRRHRARLPRAGRPQGAAVPRRQPTTTAGSTALGAAGGRGTVPVAGAPRGRRRRRPRG